MRWLLRTSGLLASSLAVACTTPCPVLDDDTSTTHGTLADGTAVDAKGAVFGGLADDGSETMPPLDASFQVAGADGRTLTIEVRAPIAWTLPPRDSSDVEVCLTNAGPGAVTEKCETPTVTVALNESSADCSQVEHGNICLVTVAGELRIEGGTMFNGTVQLSHHEHWGSCSIFDDEGSTPIL